MTDVIRVHGLGKQYWSWQGDRPNTLKSIFIRGLRLGRGVERFWALRDITFTVKSGRTLGILGSNGAGKSTLLRLIGGVGKPDEGSVEINGEVGALLDIGAGTHPDFTGRENIFVTGVIAGLTRREIRERFDSIVEFSELEDFIDSPWRTYSTGMQMRLSFAVAVHITPNILLIDEALAVGDLRFQQKCVKRIEQMKADGCTILLVSHDPGMISNLCDEVIWLRAGRVVLHGDPEVAIGQYAAEMNAETNRRIPAAPPVMTSSGVELRVNENRFGSLEMELRDVRLLNKAQRPAGEIQSGDFLRVEVSYSCSQSIKSPLFSFSITREDGTVCYDTSTAAANLAVPVLKGSGTVVLELERLDLNGGRYFINVGVFEQEWAYAYDYHWHVYPLLVRTSGSDRGILWTAHAVGVPQKRSTRDQSPS